jgi:hypothetical protein
MDLSPISTNTAMAGIARQLETNATMQTAILKQMAESQEQMAEMLHELGLGLSVDLHG